MKFRHLILICLVLTFLIPGIAATIPQSEAAFDDYLTDGDNWARIPLQFRHVYFADGFWGNASGALALLYFNSSSNIHSVAWFNVDPDYPNMLMAPYEIINTTGLHDDASGLALYNDTAVIFSKLDTGAPADVIWYYVTDDGFSTTTTGTGQTINDVCGISNTIKHGNHWYVFYQDVNDDVGFYGTNGEAENLYVEPVNTAHNDNFNLLISGISGTSDNLRNKIFIITPTDVAGGAAGEFRLRYYVYDSSSATMEEIGTNFDNWMTTPTGTRSFNWLSWNTADSGAGGYVAFLVAYLDNSGRYWISVYQLDIAAGGAGGDDSTPHAYAGGIGTGYLPCGYHETWMESVVSDQDIGEELSDFRIAGYGYGDGGTTLTTALNDGTLGEAYLTPDFLFGYQREDIYRIEVDDSFRLWYYTFLGGADIGEGIGEVINVVGQDDVLDTNQTHSSGTHYYIEDLENAKPAYAKELGFHHLGNASNIESYKVSVGVYIASNQRVVGVDNPLQLAYKKEYQYYGGDAYNYSIVLYPYINIPTQSIVAVAYGSTTALLVNKTASSETMYNTTQYMPSTITYLESEGAEDKALYLVWAQLQIDPTGSVPDDPSVVENTEQFIVPRVLQLGYAFGLSPLAIGLMLWLFSCMLVVVIPVGFYNISNIPPAIYGVFVLVVTFIFVTMGLIPVLYGVLAMLAIVGLGAFTVTKFIGGGGGNSD